MRLSLPIPETTPTHTHTPWFPPTNSISVSLQLHFSFYFGNSLPSDFRGSERRSNRWGHHYLTANYFWVCAVARVMWTPGCRKLGALFYNNLTTGILIPAKNQLCHHFPKICKKNRIEPFFLSSKISKNWTIVCLSHNTGLELKFNFVSNQIRVMLGKQGILGGLFLDKIHSSHVTFSHLLFLAECLAEGNTVLHFLLFFKIKNDWEIMRIRTV